jgi:hypothetical protein
MMIIVVTALLSLLLPLLLLLLSLSLLLAPLIAPAVSRSFLVPVSESWSVSRCGNHFLVIVQVNLLLLVIGSRSQFRIWAIRRGSEGLRQLVVEWIVFVHVSPVLLGYDSGQADSCDDGQALFKIIGNGLLIEEEYAFGSDGIMSIHLTRRDPGAMFL